MKTKDLIILDRHYDRQTDAWLILGRRLESDISLPSFTVAWSPRLAPDNLYQAQSFLDDASARCRYERIVMNDGHPRAKAFNNDLQKKLVYQWEDDSLDAYDRNIVDRDAAKKLIQIIVRAYKIDPPKLVWGKTGRSNYNHCDSNVLDLADLSLLRLLHEMAHVVHLKAQQDCGIDPDQSPDHGPAFVWIAVELYQRYGGLDLGYLIETAHQRQLLGPMHKSQNLFPEQNVFSYPVSVRRPDVISPP